MLLLMEGVTLASHANWFTPLVLSRRLYNLRDVQPTGFNVDASNERPSEDVPSRERTKRDNKLVAEKENEVTSEPVNSVVQIFPLNGNLRCNCRKPNCKHLKAIRDNGGGNGNGTKQIENECGSNKALELQNKLNGQLDSLTGVPGTQMTIRDNGNGAQAPSQPQLDLSNPFQQSEQLDIDQIEGRSNGELVHKLSNGEYVISYKGIMTLSERHDIEFETAIHDDTHTVIAKGRCGTSERVSGKPMNGCADTAIELAKRNAARQLLPLAEIKAIEKKAQLESDFDWQTAYTKCIEIVGTKAIVDIIITDLVNQLKSDD